MNKLFAVVMIAATLGFSSMAYAEDPYLPDVEHYSNERDTLLGAIREKCGEGLYESASRLNEFDIQTVDGESEYQAQALRETVVQLDAILGGCSPEVETDSEQSL